MNIRCMDRIVNEINHAVTVVGSDLSWSMCPVQLFIISLFFFLFFFELYSYVLQEKGIETHEKTQPNGKTKQVFFFDPDGGF